MFAQETCIFTQEERNRLIRMKVRNGIIGVALLAMFSMPAMVSYADDYGPGVEDVSSASFAPSFSVERFALPEDAGMLVVVEGTEGSNCNVYVYGRNEASPNSWILKLETPGYLGRNGMSNHRTEGDKTTPIGLFQMNTPFGQADPQDGFPESYMKVNADYVWTEDTNRLVKNPKANGEHVGTAGYSEYYDYVIDMGYNKNAAAKKGSALFLHCHGHNRTETSGCVSIEKSKMEEIMKLYGACGEGRSYIALAPSGTFEGVYDSYESNFGLSPEGEF